MIKKITKSKNNLSIEIDKAIAESLGINQETDIEMIVMDDMLIIKPKNKKLRTAKKKQTSLNDLTNNLMDKYDSVLKKLAKT